MQTSVTLSTPNILGFFMAVQGEVSVCICAYPIFMESRKVFYFWRSWGFMHFQSLDRGSHLNISLTDRMVHVYRRVRMQSILNDAFSIKVTF